MTESKTPRYIERQLVTRSDEGDCRAAIRMLEGLPGIRRVCIDPKGGTFTVTFDPRRVTDDELLATLHQHGFELVSWQPAGLRGRSRQRQWLLEQIGELVKHAEDLDRGDYAEGMMKGAADAYLRAGRAFGLIMDEEIRELIPPRFLEHAHTV